MRRIDLTMNGDFSGSDTVSANSTSLSFMEEGLANRTPIIRRDSKNKIRSSEANSGFLTGSIDSINGRENLLKIVQSISGSEPLCDRCGVDLVFDRQSTLCKECDLSLDKEFRSERLMKMLLR